MLTILLGGFLGLFYSVAGHFAYSHSVDTFVDAPTVDAGAIAVAITPPAVLVLALLLVRLRYMGRKRRVALIGLIILLGLFIGAWVYLFSL